MGFILKTWENPIAPTANDLNRVERGIKDSHDTLAILRDEVSNIILKQLDTDKTVKALLKESPNILETLDNIQSVLNNNSNILETLKDTSNLVTKQQLSDTIKSYLPLKDIKQDGKSIVKDEEVNIISPKVDTILSKASNNAIANSTVAIALEKLTSNIIIPTHLKDLQEDSTHRLITDDERNLWNTIKNISFEETDPTVPNWAKQKDKPTYEWNEILNTPTIYKHISEFPDSPQYSTITHTHNNLYALLQHDHDNRYAAITHKHLGYADTEHNHNEMYAPLNHTHEFNFDSSLITNELNGVISKITELESNLHIVATTGDYLTLLNRPDLTLYTLNDDFNKHNHDAKYSDINHTHSEYSLTSHIHDDLYSKLNHTHNYDNKYALIVHDHDEYSLTTHNHNTVYSPINHNHNGVYANYDHNHDTLYATKDHEHSNYALTGHTHDYSKVYAAIKHTHTEYSTTDHTHTEFSSIMDATSVQNLIDKSIEDLVGSAHEDLDTLEELSKALQNNKDIITTLNSAITNKADKNHTHDYASSSHNHDSVYSKIHDHPYASNSHNHDSAYINITGDTMTGNLTIDTNAILINKGTASSNGIRTRGIDGANTDGTIGDLYLQNNKDYKTYFGKSANSSLNADGTITEAGTLLSNKYAPKSHNQSITTITNSAGNTFTAAKVLTAKSHTGWANNATDDRIIPTMSFMAFWNGAYNSNNSSNLTYCNRGAFGTIVTKNTGDYAAASHTHSYSAVYTGSSATKGSNTTLSTLRIGFASNNLYIWNS